MLARAVAKGLLGGVVPEESKKGKKEKRRKDHRDPADSRPSSPSSHDGETGNEFEDGPDPVYATELDEKKGGDEREKGKGGKKRGVKGRKQKVKRRPKQSAAVSKQHQKDSKKPVKKKLPPQHRRHLRKRRARKIPRLTLSSISSAKPSGCFSTITALAHKLSQNVAIESQQTPHLSGRPPASRLESRTRPLVSHPGVSACPPASLPAATWRKKTDAGRAEKTLKTFKAGTSKPRSKAARPETEVTTQVGSEAADLVLPPISMPSHSSGSKSGSSASRHHSQASRSMMSASSSLSLLGL